MNQIESDVASGVAKMRRRVWCDAADIHVDLAGTSGLKRSFFACSRIIHVQCHDSLSTLTVCDSEATPGVIPTHSPLIAHDVAGATFDTVLILEFHFLKALVTEVVALCGATPYTHHVRAIIAFAGLNDNVGVFVLIDIVSNQPQTVLDIVGKETQFN
tara:strand:- start:61 stop:534 length:474 start_codon:yes stop_codon:yes gene_type:complete